MSVSDIGNIIESDDLLAAYQMILYYRISG